MGDIKKCSYCKLKKEVVFDTGIYKFCSNDCRFNMGKVILNKQKKKAKQVAVKKDKEFNRRTRQLKESIKKRTGKKGFYDNLKVQLHKYIKHVLRKGEPCYTCGLKQRYEDSPQAFHVGHFIPQKQVDPRRFMLMNLRIQCNSCNTHNSGMRAEYRQRLIDEIGVDKVEWLECDINHKSLKEQYPDVSDIKAETARYRKLTVSRETII